MKVTVKLFAELRDLLPRGSSNGSCVVKIRNGDTVSSVFKELKIPEDEVHMVFINSGQAKKDSVVGDGDTISAFPPAESE